MLATDTVRESSGIQATISGLLLLELHRRWLYTILALKNSATVLMLLCGSAIVAQDTHVLLLVIFNRHASTTATLSFVHNASMHRTITTQFGLQTIKRVLIVAHLEELLRLSHIVSEIIIDRVRLVASVDDLRRWSLG